jgi:hypothetical protein
MLRLQEYYIEIRKRNICLSSFGPETEMDIMDDTDDGRTSNILPVMSRENGAVLFFDVENKTLLSKDRISK